MAPPTNTMNHGETMLSLNRRLAGVSTAALIGAATMLLPIQAADAVMAPTCRATMSDSTPSQYSNVYVNVVSGPNVAVRTTARYKTTSTVHTGRTGSTGKVGIRYYISGSTPGFRVVVSVSVTGPAGTGYCSTSFVAHA